MATALQRAMFASTRAASVQLLLHRVDHGLLVLHRPDQIRDQALVLHGLETHGGLFHLAILPDHFRSFHLLDQGRIDRLHLLRKQSVLHTLRHAHTRMLIDVEDVGLRGERQDALQRCLSGNVLDVALQFLVRIHPRAVAQEAHALEISSPSRTSSTHVRHAAPHRRGIAGVELPIRQEITAHHSGSGTAASGVRYHTPVPTCIVRVHDQPHILRSDAGGSTGQCMFHAALDPHHRTHPDVRSGAFTDLLVHVQFGLGVLHTDAHIVLLVRTGIR